MDSTREKLVELVMRAYLLEPEDIADYLIANGVTFGKDDNVPAKFETDNSLKRK